MQKQPLETANESKVPEGRTYGKFQLLEGGRESGVQGRPEPHSVFEASLDYIIEFHLRNKRVVISEGLRDREDEWAERRGLLGP